MTLVLFTSCAKAPGAVPNADDEFHTVQDLSIARDIAERRKERLDKDRFRRDMGGVEEAYQEVYRRLVPAEV